MGKKRDPGKKNLEGFFFFLERDSIWWDSLSVGARGDSSEWSFHEEDLGSFASNICFAFFWLPHILFLLWWNKSHPTNNGPLIFKQAPKRKECASSVNKCQQSMQVYAKMDRKAHKTEDNNN